MTKEELDKVLKDHLKWLKDSTKGQRADLGGSKLSYVNLKYANLRYADLGGSKLSYVNLSNANLRYADLSYADLRDTILYNADLSNTNLSNAKLSYVNLKYANLRYANLSNTILYTADLRYTNLSNADLEGANLSYADLRDTILPEGFYYANLGKHTLYAYKGMIRIGCKYLSVEDWLKNGKAIAKEFDYDKADIKRYLDFIRQYKKECKNEK